MEQQGPYHNSPLLNEIHQYFPALLYNNEDFMSMADVFGYIRNQMRSRFDTYSNLREQYQSQRPQTRNNYNRNNHPVAPIPIVTQHQRRNNYNRNNRPVAPIPLATSPVTTRPNTRIVVNELNTLLNNIELNRLFYSAMGINPVGFSDPVLITPTPEQIDTGSVLQNILTPSDTPCSICQDVINQGDEVRRLNHCHHVFHRNCIDTWYQRNVRCPVCRHDIRNV